jgi:hypothetical protein
MIRVINPDGRPVVKLGGSVDGGGLGLVGVEDATAVLLKAEGTTAMLRVTNQDGRKQLVEP